MRPNPIREALSEGSKLLNAWCSIASAHVAELIAHQGYDSVTIDLQHGAVDYQVCVDMLRAISTTNATPFVRVPWNEPAMPMKVLDAGAYGVICPMISTAEDAQAFVSACRYPPDGQRSFGPNRAVQYSQTGSGTAYWREAANQPILLAMIETRGALECLDDILRTPGLDGVYVGPGDLSLALGVPPSMAPTDKTVTDAMKYICSSAKERELITAVHTDGPATARKRFAEGFQICTLQGDARLLVDGAKAQVRAARG